MSTFELNIFLKPTFGNPIRLLALDRQPYSQIIFTYEWQFLLLCRETCCRFRSDNALQYLLHWMCLVEFLTTNFMRFFSLHFHEYLSARIRHWNSNEFHDLISAFRIFPNKLHIISILERFFYVTSEKWKKMRPSIIATKADTAQC